MISLFEFSECCDYTKTSLTNIKFDIKNLMYAVSEIRSMMEHIFNTLNSSGTLNTQEIYNNSNVLNSENVPITNEKTLENVEIELENEIIRSQVVSVVLMYQ